MTKSTKENGGQGRAFEDTVRNLLRMKPKPHKGRAEDEEKEPRPDAPDEAGASPSEGRKD